MSTYREYIEDNAADILAELCQYQNCDNCSIGGIHYEQCPLKEHTCEEVLDMEMDNGY